MSDETVARDPAYWGEFEWGYARWGTNTDRWERSIKMRTLYRGIANTNVVRDSPTGWRTPTYTYYAITGLLVERGMTSAYLPSGVGPKLDAVLVTLDGFFLRDRVYDHTMGKLYEVAEQPVAHTDPEEGGLAYRECQLKWLPFTALPTV